MAGPPTFKRVMTRGGAFVDIAKASPGTRVDYHTQTSVGAGATLQAGDTLTVEALTETEANAVSRARGSGVVGIAKASGDVRVGDQYAVTSIDIGANASLKGANVELTARVPKLDASMDARSRVRALTFADSDARARTEVATGSIDDQALAFRPGRTHRGTNPSLDPSRSGTMTSSAQAIARRARRSVTPTRSQSTVRPDGDHRGEGRDLVTPRCSTALMRMPCPCAKKQTGGACAGASAQRYHGRASRASRKRNLIDEVTGPGRRESMRAARLIAAALFCALALVAIPRRRTRSS
jgi:predicted RecA/RadA family phage recombinase